MTQNSRDDQTPAEVQDPEDRIPTVETETDGSQGKRSGRRNRRTLRVPEDEVPRTAAAAVARATSDGTAKKRPIPPVWREETTIEAPRVPASDPPRQARITQREHTAEIPLHEQSAANDAEDAEEISLPGLTLEVPGISRPPSIPDPAKQTKSVSSPAAPLNPPEHTDGLMFDPTRVRVRGWWEEFFDDDYLHTVRTPTDEQISKQCDFIERCLDLEPGATVLDVGCGLGQHAVELSARGYQMVGLDLSLSMLSHAADLAQERSQKINFLHADMREMNFEGAFDAIVCWGTTFGYFDEDANRQLIKRIHRALKPMGIFLLDVVNRDHVLSSQPNLVWFEGEGCICMEETHFNYLSSRLHVRRTVMLETGKQKETEYSVRLYSIHELGQFLHTAGFRVVEASGLEATPGVFFGNNSPRLLILAERRAKARISNAPPSNET